MARSAFQAVVASAGIVLFMAPSFAQDRVAAGSGSGQCSEEVLAPSSGTIVALDQGSPSDILIVYADTDGVIRSIAGLNRLSPGLGVGANFTEGQVLGSRAVPCSEERSEPARPEGLQQIAASVRLPPEARHVTLVGEPKTTARLRLEAREDLKRHNPQKYEALVRLEAASRELSSMAAEFEADLATYQAQCTGTTAEVVTREAGGSALGAGVVREETKRREESRTVAVGGGAAVTQRDSSAGMAVGAGVAAAESRSASVSSTETRSLAARAWRETVTWTTLQERARTPECQRLYRELQHQRVQIQQRLLPAVKQARAAGWLEAEIRTVLKDGGLPWLVVQ